MKSLVSILLLMLFYAPVWAQCTCESGKRLLLSDGHAEISAENDSVRLWMTVLTEHTSLDQAGSENTTKTKRVISALKAMRIKEMKLKTASFRVMPQREREGQFRKIIGYEVRNTVQVTMEEVSVKIMAARVSKMIASGLENGVNSIANLSFYIKNIDELEKRALARAVQQAMAKAKVLAQSAGVKLTRIAKISTQPDGHSRARAAFRGAEMAVQAAALAPPVEVGESKVTVNVNVAYEIE